LLCGVGLLLPLLLPALLVLRLRRCNTACDVEATSAAADVSTCPLMPLLPAAAVTAAMLPCRVVIAASCCCSAAVGGQGCAAWRAAAGVSFSGLYMYTLPARDTAFWMVLRVLWQGMVMRHRLNTS
jgi:hypothetical protein